LREVRRTGNGKPNQTQTERPVPGRGRQGKGGLRVTRCHLRETAERGTFGGSES
jgi:hypothetical protein